MYIDKVDAVTEEIIVEPEKYIVEMTREELEILRDITGAFDVSGKVFLLYQSFYKALPGYDSGYVYESNGTQVQCLEFR